MDCSECFFLLPQPSKEAVAIDRRCGHGAVALARHDLYMGEMGYGKLDGNQVVDPYIAVAIEGSVEHRAQPHASNIDSAGHHVPLGIVVAV